MDDNIKIEERKTGANIIFAEAGVLCFYESLVQGSSSVFQMNICAENPRLRKYENRLEPVSKRANWML